MATPGPALQKGRVEPLELDELVLFEQLREAGIRCLARRAAQLRAQGESVMLQHRPIVHNTIAAMKTSK